MGRLDRDSEGLLLLTNNGKLQHRIAHRQFAHPRTYWVQVEGNPGDRDLQPLRQGIPIQDYQTRPARIKLLDTEPDLPPREPPIRYRKSIPTAWLEMLGFQAIPCFCKCDESALPTCVGTNRGFLAIGDWLKSYCRALIELFNPPKQRLPSYRTIRRVLLTLDYRA